MDDKININYMLDSQGARLERTNKRLFILSIILLIAFFVSNSLWVMYELQMVDQIEIEQEIDTGEGDAFVNGIGDLNYAEGKTEGN